MPDTQGGKKELMTVPSQSTTLRDLHLVSVSEAADILKIHRNTVRIWCDAGLIQTYRVGPRRDRRIPMDALRQVLNDNTIRMTEEKRL